MDYIRIEAESYDINGKVIALSVAPCVQEEFLNFERYLGDLSNLDDNYCLNFPSNFTF